MWSTVKMKWDRPTVLMADIANLSGQFSVWYSGNWAKRFHVSKIRNSQRPFPQTGIE